MEETVRHGKIVEPSEKTKDVIVSIITIIFFSALMSVTLCMLLNPIGLYGAGLTGVAQIILHVIEILDPAIAWNELTEKWLWLLSLILFLPFNVLAFFKLSKKYALYTFISTVVQIVVMMFAEPLGELHVLYTKGEPDILATVVVSALLCGISDGMLMRRGSTSGGIIVLCQYLNFKKDRSVGAINIIVTSFIIIVGGLISSVDNSNFAEGLSTALYTLLCYGLSSIVLDYIHTSYNKVKLEVVTEKGDEIAQALIKAFPHGVTIEDGTGAYTGRNKKVLNSVIHKFECNKYLSIIRGIDSDAFISIIPIWRLNGRFTINIIDK